MKQWQEKVELKIKIFFGVTNQKRNGKTKSASSIFMSALPDADVFDMLCRARKSMKHGS
jgi:hypothetical protein